MAAAQPLAESLNFILISSGFNKLIESADQISTPTNLRLTSMNKFALAIAATTTLVFTQACSQLVGSREIQAAPTPVAVPNPHEGHVMNKPQHGTQKSAKPESTQITLTLPDKVTVNTPTNLVIDVQDKQGKAIDKFDIFQEKLMHLIVVSDDLQFFDHLHPDRKGNGRFTVTANFPVAGSYTIFSDYKPTGQKEQVSIARTTVNGVIPASTNLDFGRIKTVDGTKVVLSASESELQVGQEVTFTFNLTDANSDRPIQDLQPYLGERGHLVILRQSQPLSKSDYIHAHALKNTPDGQVSFMTAFPKPGKYKLWGQFNRGGKIAIADFWVDVRDESRPASKPLQPHH